MLAKFYGKSVEDFPVVIEEIQFLQATVLQPDGMSTHTNRNSK